MTLYREQANGFVKWTGGTIDGVQHPLTIEQVWTDDELAAINLYRPAEADPVAEGKVSKGMKVERIDGAVRYVHDLGNAPASSTDPADYRLLPWQFKAMVDYLGKDDEIRSAIGTIQDPLQRAASMSRYLHASSYEFGDPLLQQMRQAVGMSEENLSAAWMLAKDLRSA